MLLPGLAMIVLTDQLRPKYLISQSIDAIVRCACLGEDEFEMTSDKYDTRYDALIYWFVLNNHFDLLFEMIDLMCLY